MSVFVMKLEELKSRFLVTGSHLLFWGTSLLSGTPLGVSFRQGQGTDMCTGLYFEHKAVPPRKYSRVISARVPHHPLTGPVSLAKHQGPTAVKAVSTSPELSHPEPQLRNHEYNTGQQHCPVIA